MKQVGYIGIDQYNTHYHIKKHPRKELLDQLGKTKARVMYADKKDGSIIKMGYVIGSLWISIYKVHTWQN